MILYRRHTTTCPHRRKGRNFHACSCPIHSAGKSLGTSDWAAAEKLVRNPAASSRTRRSPVQATEAYTRPYTAVECLAIRQSCHELKTNAARHKALALVSLQEETGMRISDAAMLRRDAIDRECWVHFRAIKNGAKVDLPLSRETVELLNTLPGAEFFFHSPASNPDRTIFRMGRLLARVFTLSRVEGAHSHRYRHTIASNAAANGADIRTIAAILGDTPAIAELHYIHLTEGYKGKIREALRSTP